MKKQNMLNFSHEKSSEVNITGGTIYLSHSYMNTEQSYNDIAFNFG